MIELLLFASLWIFGVNFLITDERSFLSWWDRKEDNNGVEIYNYLIVDYYTPSWIAKPLFNCVMCMASVHGTLVYWLFEPAPSLHGWVFFCVALCGLNYIITEIIWD